MDKECLARTYGCAEEYLKKMTPDEIDIEKYLSGPKPCNTINDIFKIMCRSLQNRNMMSKVIKFQIYDADFEKILFDFDPKKTLENHDVDSLYGEFVGSFPIKNPENPRNLWLQYAKYIISACRWMAVFKDINDFRNFVSPYQKESASMALPLLLKKEIKGMGFALACDFLKEIGYMQYPKPDTHLIDVFSACGICEKDQYEVYKAIIRMAESCDITPFHVDKVFWLICSGNFYLDGIKIIGEKADFIDACRASFECR